jgi:hypothetical protein
MKTLSVCTYLLPHMVPFLIRQCHFSQPQAVHFQCYHKIFRETNKLKRLHEVESVVLLNLCWLCCKHMQPMWCSTHKPQHRLLWNTNCNVNHCLHNSSHIIYCFALWMEERRSMKYLACVFISEWGHFVVVDRFPSALEGIVMSTFRTEWFKADQVFISVDWYHEPVGIVFSLMISEGIRNQWDITFKQNYEVSESQK